MNTNSKHYEELNIQPWEIMERNFTTEEFVAYLKGNIIKYTLRDKGQALTDAEKIKHYAEKLIEVIEKKETDEFLKEDAEHIYGKAEPVSEHKFKVGDRVIVDKGENDKRKGTIIRLPQDGLDGSRHYVVDIGNHIQGWRATIAEDGVSCESACYASENNMELLKEEPKKALIPNKWYDAEDFTEEELKELLPMGTKVVVTEDYTTNKKDINEVELGKETWLNTIVNNIGKNKETKRTRVGITGDIFFRRYFRLVGEN